AAPGPGTDVCSPHGHFTIFPTALAGTLNRRLQLPQDISIFCPAAAGAAWSNCGICRTVPQPHLALRPATLAVTGNTLLQFGHWTRIFNISDGSGGGLSFEPL
ncbi:hypothetical protein N9Y42_10810, partial [Mariniblastus sp.]|nr:hypothetical protein [Mariniblastus sp.]